MVKWREEANNVLLRLRRKYHLMLDKELIKTAARKKEHFHLAYKDYIHFVSSGYQVLADLLFQALLRDYENFLKNEQQ